jgi:Rieske 2Fe-2S family protein
VSELATPSGALRLAPSLDGAWYADAAVFAAELEAFYAHRFVCVGRGSEIAEPGAYVTREVAGESLVLVRGEDGAARAFYNVCRHRGTRICTEERGHAPGAGGLTCPYHGWTYGIDGALLGAPLMGEVAWFDKADYPLHPAGLEEWEGFLFAHLEPRAAPTLADSLRPLAGRFAPWRLPELVTARRIDYDVRTNWKLIFQNFSECYHCPPVHPALAKISHYRSGANDLREGGLLGGYMLINEGTESLTMSGRHCAAPITEMPAEQLRRVYYYSLYPSLFLTIQPDFVMATRIEPLAPDRTRIIAEWLFAPEAAARPGFDPSDGVELWDLTNRQDWRMCELALEGISSRAYRPGLYSGDESLLAAFDQEYLASLGEGG